MEHLRQVLEAAGAALKAADLPPLRSDAFASHDCCFGASVRVRTGDPATPTMVADTDRHETADAFVAAVTVAPSLIDIAEAAAKYREAVDARSNESNPASRLILFSVVMQAEAALFAALDRAAADAPR